MAAGTAALMPVPCSVIVRPVDVVVMVVIVGRVVRSSTASRQLCTANRTALSLIGRVMKRSGPISIASSAVRIGPVSSPITTNATFARGTMPRSVSISDVASPTSSVAVITTTGGCRA